MRTVSIESTLLLFLLVQNFLAIIDIINLALSDKNQGLGNITSCPKDTSILNAAEDSDSGKDNDEDDDQEINIEQEINQLDYEIAQGNVGDKIEEKAITLKNICKPHNKKGTVRS